MTDRKSISPQRVQAPYTIVACFGMACATLAAIFMSPDKWGDLGRILTTPAGEGSAFGLLVMAGGLYMRARHQPPPLGLLLALVLAASVSGCGGLSASQRERLTVETQLCLLNEREIVDRPGSTLAEDQAALAAERARCDAARAAIVEGP